MVCIFLKGKMLGKVKKITKYLLAILTLLLLIGFVGYASGFAQFWFLYLIGIVVLPIPPLGIAYIVLWFVEKQRK
jgi:hypothetical protein